MHLAAIDLHGRPRLPLAVEKLFGAAPVAVPPLIKGCLKCGAVVLGPPAWEPDFNSADLPMLVRLAGLPASYKQALFGRFPGVCWAFPGRFLGT